MPQFVFRATDRMGNTVEGSVAADNQADALAQVRDMGYTPIQVQPKGAATVFATGSDPANRSLTYKVYGREYGHALVLYKPLSYTRGVSGTTAANTATTHKLDGWYRSVRADGSFGQPVRQVSLRNGEGAVLVRA